MNKMIEMNNIHKRFGERQVLQGIDFSIDEGEIIGLVGPNGAGKTTLIRLLNGVIAPDKGTISIDGYHPIVDGQIVRARSGTLTEDAGLYEELTAYQNLTFFAKLYRVENLNRIDELLDQLGLYEARNQKVITYSTGMKKRLGLAKVLLHKPDFLFLDEPTNGLDPEGIHLIMKSIREMNQKHQTTILICSHILSQLELLCNRFIFISQGSIIEQGSQRELADRYLKQIKLRVETTYHHPERRIGSYQYEIDFAGEMVFTLKNRQEVSQVLKLLTAEAEVYAAEIMNRDLETLYFEVKNNYNG